MKHPFSYLPSFYLRYEKLHLSVHPHHSMQHNSYYYPGHKCSMTKCVTPCRLVIDVNFPLGTGQCTRGWFLAHYTPKPVSKRASLCWSPYIGTRQWNIVRVLVTAVHIGIRSQNTTCMCWSLQIGTQQTQQWYIACVCSSLHIGARGQKVRTCFFSPHIGTFE